MNPISKGAVSTALVAGLLTDWGCSRTPANEHGKISGADHPKQATTSAPQDLELHWKAGQSNQAVYAVFEPAVLEGKNIPSGDLLVWKVGQSGLNKKYNFDSSYFWFPIVNKDLSANPEANALLKKAFKITNTQSPEDKAAVVRLLSSPIECCNMNYINNKLLLEGSATHRFARPFDDKGKNPTRLQLTARERQEAQLVAVKKYGRHGNIK